LSGTQPWLAPGWQREAEAWTLGALIGLGISPAGPFEEFRTRPWSSIWRMTTSSGDVYFKALIPALKHEVSLTVRLAALFPDMVVPVLAADEARAWMLMPHAGLRLRDVLKREDAESTWTKLLSDAARIQIEGIPMTADFLAMGVPDRRLARLPEQLDALQELGERAVRMGSGGVTKDELARVAASRRSLLSRAERLAALELPETVQHDDLHDGNVLVRDGQAVIFDWGDASISHPFFTLRVSLGSVTETFGLQMHDELPTTLRDRYLEHWLDFGPMKRLLRAFELSRPLAIIPRILTWDLAMSSASEEEQTAPSELALLKELLEFRL
jgi:hypothetical protein